MTKKLTQNEVILSHLKEFGTISSYESFVKYNITRLSAIIYNLKEMGVKFKDDVWGGKGNESYKIYTLDN